MTAIWDDETVEPAVTRRGPRRRHEWVEAFGVASMATSVPLLRALGPEPAFFEVHGLGLVGVVLLGAVVGLGLPAALAGLVSLAGRLHPWLRQVALGLLAGVAAAGLLQPLSGSLVFLVLSLLVAVLVGFFEPRSGIVRGSLLVAAGWSVLVLLWFVFASSGAGVLRSHGDAAVAAPPTLDQPVVVITLDELPLSALLGSDMTINAERYPAFARLAEQADWFPRAAAASASASSSVPAIWSGTTPDAGGAPVASQEPDSLFAQLGQTHVGVVDDPVTALCPLDVCDESPPDDRAGQLVDSARPGLLRHLGEVYVQSVGTEGMRSGARPYDRAWTGRVEAGAAAIEVDDGDDPVDPAPSDERAHEEERDDALRWAEDCRRRADRPPLCAIHLSLPRQPYGTNPDGSVYAETAYPLDGTEVTAEGAVVWGEDETLRQQGYQRLLLQLGATDRLLGQLLDQLEENGVWDDAAVAVVAAHGVSFDAGFLWTGDVEVTAVPMFIKAPGQTTGSTQDVAASTLDVAPTLLGLLGLEVGAEVDGLDLYRAEVPERRDDGYLLGTGPGTPDQSAATLQELVERRRSWVDPDGGWGVVAATGEHAGLLGERTSTLEVGDAGGSWVARPQPDGEAGNVRPVAVRAEVELEGVVAVLDGRIVATLPGVSPGTYTLRTVVADPAEVDAASQLELYGVDEAGDLRPLAPEQPSEG